MCPCACVDVACVYKYSFRLKTLPGSNLTLFHIRCPIPFS